MIKAKLLCTSKTGIETFTVHLEPYAEAVSPACKVCGRTTHKDYCTGGDGVLEPRHDPVVMEEGDTSFFRDLPHGTIFLSVLTPEAASHFEVGKITTITFETGPEPIAK